MSTLRRKSRKRAALDRKVKPFRTRLIATVGQCELCNRNFSLFCHEIASGTASRRKALDQSCAILVLCNAPHSCRPSCHSVVQNWPREKQLALLLIRRGGDYDLAKFWEIVGMRKPQQCDVDGWVQQLISEGK